MLVKLRNEIFFSSFGRNDALDDIPNSHRNQAIDIHLSDSLHKVKEESGIARLEVIYKMKQKNDEIVLKNKVLSELEQKQYVN